MFIITPRQQLRSTTPTTDIRPPPGSPVSMRTTFCKYLDRSSRLLPLLNPPFVLGPTRPGPSVSLTSPSFKLRIHQSTCTRSHHPVVQACSPKGEGKALLLPVARSVSHIYITVTPPGQFLAISCAYPFSRPAGQVLLFTNSGRLCPLRTLTGGSFGSSSSGPDNCWGWFSTRSHTGTKGPVSTSSS